MAKKQQTKTTKHTIEFSNNRPACRHPTKTARKTRDRKAANLGRTCRNTLRSRVIPGEAVALSGLAVSRRREISYGFGNSESNRLLEGGFRVVKIIPAPATALSGSS